MTICAQAIEPAGQALSTERITSCPVCRASSLRELFLFDGKVPIVGCTACRSQFAGRYFTEEELSRFYSGEYFHGSYGYRDYEALEQMKGLTFANRLAALERVLPQRGDLLDVGCADGSLVRCAGARGWRAFGIDISSEVIAGAKERDRSAHAIETGYATRNAHMLWQQWSGRYRAATLEQLAPALPKFDALSMSDLIEHVQDPHTLLAAAKQALRPGGSLLIETPNVGGVSAWLMRSAWPLYRPPEHLVYYCRSSLTALLKLHGFEQLETHTSYKAVTFDYLADKLAVTGSGLAALCRAAGKLAGSRALWLPVGSFWLIAKLSLSRND